MFAQFEEQRDKLQSKVFSADQHHKDAMQEIKKTSTDRESWFSSHSDPKVFESSHLIHPPRSVSALQVFVSVDRTFKWG